MLSDLLSSIRKISMSNIPVLHNPHPSTHLGKKIYKLALDVLILVKCKIIFFPPICILVVLYV